MNGVNAGDLSRADHSRNIEVAFRGARGADANGLISETDVQRVTIGFAVYRNGLDAQLFAGADDAQGDFPRLAMRIFLNII